MSPLYNRENRTTYGNEFCRLSLLLVHSKMQRGGRRYRQPTLRRNIFTTLAIKQVPCAPNIGRNIGQRPEILYRR